MKSNYIKHKIVNMININKIVTIHYHELDKNFSFDGESHNFWEMVYVDAGEVEIDTDECSYLLKQGEMIFHKPNEFHTLKANKRNASNVFVISFVCSSEIMSFFENKVISLSQKLKKYIANILEEYDQTFKYMASKDVKLELKENSLIGGQQMIKTYLEQLLIMLIRAEQGNSNMQVFSSKGNMENHIVSEIVEIIQKNIYEKIYVEEICKELNYSRAYLSRLFKATTGYTILEYILICKIKEAKKLIRGNNYNFTQISAMLSFDNPHYFSIVFKRITGITPTNYKNSVGKI